MIFKSKPMWFKGGAIGFLFITLILLLNIFLELVYGGVPFRGEFSMFFFFIISVWAYVIADKFGINALNSGTLVIIILIPLIGYTLLGCLVGFVLTLFKR